MTNFQNVDGKTKPWVSQAAHALAQMFGLKTVGGWRASDPFPDHPSGLALDLMINDIPNGSATGQRMADYAAANASALGVKYIIWNRRSWNPQRGTWAPYTGSNPHTDHVHITFNSTPGTGIQQVVDGAQNLGSSVVSSLFDVDKLMNKVEGTTITLTAAAFGLVLIGVGVVLTVKRKKG